MAHEITRRDFLNGAQIAIGASLLGACTKNIGNFPSALGTDYYPPALTGLRGSHDGSWETMHARVTGTSWPPTKPEEHYDLVIVGGGISGLAAARFYRKSRPDARILILDNHDDFGGHAKRNEFRIGDPLTTFNDPLLDFSAVRQFCALGECLKRLIVSLEMHQRSAVERKTGRCVGPE